MTETSDVEARSAARRFHSSLEGQLKKYDAIPYVITASACIKEAMNGQKDKAQWRMHQLIHSIEAMCAYRRGHRSTIPDDRALAKVLNVYYEYDDPYTHYLLEVEQDLHLAFRTMATQQFPFQYRPHYRDIARAYSVFCKGLDQTAQLFEKDYGLSIIDWFRVSVCCFALINSDLASVVTTKQAMSAAGWGEPPIEPKAIHAFLKTTSRTIEETGLQFHADRDNLQRPYLYGLIQSGFISAPLLKCDLDTYVCPAPGLLFRNAADGLIKRCRKYDPVFGDEIGTAFETYVEAVLNQLPNCRMTRPDKLQINNHQRACDFAVETNDAVLLFECKAVSETAHLMLESTIRNQNATTQINDGVDQIRDTARRSQDGSLGFDVAGRRLFGFVVTYGYILFANSEWYRTKILGWDNSASESDLETVANILSINDLELFVLVVASTELSAKQLIELKEAENYITSGDWETFLQQVIRDRNTNHVHLDVAQRDMEELFTSTMGDERYKQMMDSRNRESENDSE